MFDKILSGNKDVACDTCHLPSQSTGDGRSLSVGTGGTGGVGPSRQLGAGRVFTPRSATDIFDRGTPLYHTAFWDMRVQGDAVSGFRTPAGAQLPPGLDGALAAQAMFPVTARTEMRGNVGDVTVDGQPNELATRADTDFTGIWSDLTKRLLAIPAYQALFAAAYPDVPLDQIGFQHAANAIAAFESQAYTHLDSPFDRYLAGSDSALTLSQKRGAMLFYGRLNCAACHSGPFMSDQQAHDIGCPQFGPGKGPEAPQDFGLEDVTGQPSDRCCFRTPQLRNVELTGPYLHDGAYTTLEGAIRQHLNPSLSLQQYDVTQLIAPLQGMLQGAEVPMQLQNLDPLLRTPQTASDAEMADLVAFLKSLTDPAMRDLSGVVPPSVPSGLPIDR